MEIDEYAKRQSCQAQVRDDLGFMHRKKPFHRFDFHDQAPFHNEIEAISALDCETFVLQGNGRLPREAKPTKL